MSQFICISYQRWEVGSQRVRHLLSRIPGVSILYFEPAQPFFSRLRRPPEGECVAPGVVAYTLPCAIPTGEEMPLLLQSRSRKNAAFIRRCMKEHEFERPVLWLRCPDQVELMNELRLSHVVYDWDRFWPELPQDWENTLFHGAGLVLTASPSLYDEGRMLHDNVVLLPNGGEMELFRHAGEKPEVLPADLQACCQRPVLGYLGEVGDFTDLSPVCHAAQLHPDWTFVFVGEAAKNNPWLHLCRSRPNIHFLGSKAKVSLERYLAGFDLCFFLLDDREPDSGVVSPQMYHAMSSGKPMIAMSAGRLELSYPDVVYYAHTDQEFADSCELALEQKLPDAVSSRMRYAAQGDWSCRREYLEKLLQANGLL